MKHYLIIGSGLVGRLLAWRLILQGHQVSLLSSDDKTGTSSAGYIAAAMISPATEAVQTETKVKEIGLVSAELWPKWLAELPEQIFYQNNGTLVVAHNGDQSEMARFTRRAQHVLADDDYVELNHEQLNVKEPQLAQQFEQALFFDGEACLDNRHLYQVLTTFLTTSSQCDWQQCDVIESLSRSVIHQLSQRYFNCNAEIFDDVIDCRGNGAKADLSGLRSVRGEVIRVHAPDVDFKHAVRLIHPRYPMYLAPRPDNEYVLGATVVENDDMSPVSIRSGLELMSALYSLHKGFAEARVLEMAAHCRPAMTDNMPVIKRTEFGYQINGLYRHGYLFAPAIILDFLALLDGKQQSMKFGGLFNA
ncbi:MAG: FAD-dependent oxidoreductase [Gammaproteobacteria bacterium]|nr:FAD-dependent oxidoreductase [Gammaproteobacteria bacterium]MDT8371037.1 FAD-dependent oxidoreductase [Gammaproteobacteria bacterium]